MRTLPFSHRQKPPVGRRLDLGHPLAVGLVGCWLFNEGQGRTAVDLCGASNGSFLNGASWASGSDGVSLNSAANQYVRIPATRWQKTDAAVTHEWWWRPRSIRNYNGGFTKTVVNAAAPIDFYVDASNAANAFAGSTGSAAHVSVSNFCIAGQLQQVVVTAQTGGNMVLYRDGIAMATASASPVLDAGSDFRVGGREDAATFFDGTFQLARVWNRAISAAEIASLYADPYQMILAPNLRRFNSLTAGSPAAYFNALRMTRGAA